MEPWPLTEKEIRACTAELKTFIAGAKEDGVDSKDFAAYIRTQVGFFDYKSDEPVNPNGYEIRYAVDPNGWVREGPLDPQGRIHGAGVKRHPNGCIYEGYFRNDKLEGRGRVFDTNGSY